MNWRRWPWLEEGALPLSVLLMRLLWLWPWLLIVSRWTLPPQLRPVLPLWMVGLLMFGAAMAARLLPVDLERVWRSRAWIAGLGLLAIALALWWRLERPEHAIWDVRWILNQSYILTHWNETIPPSVMIIGLTAYLWLRGIQDSVTPNHDDIWRSFGTGFLALVILLITVRIDPAGPVPSMANWIILFFVVGMSALALAGLRLARSGRNAAAPLPVNRYWLVSIAAVVIFLTGFGLILGVVITPDGVASVTGWVRVVLNWLATALGFVVYAIVYVMFLALTPLIRWVENYIATRMQFDPERLQGMERGLFENMEDAPAVVLPTVVDETMRWTGLLIGFAIIALVFATALRILRKHRSEDEDEVRETVLSQELLRDQAATLLRRLRGVFGGNRHVSVQPYFALDGELGARRRVRAVYQSFLALMAARGLPRRKPQTPHRYAAAVANHIGEPDAAVHVLTDAYVAARYATLPMPEERAEAAAEALSTLRQRLETNDRLETIDHKE